MSRHPELLLPHQPVSLAKTRAARPAWKAVSALGIVAVLALSACTSPDPEAHPEPDSRTTTTPTTSAPPSPQPPSEPVLIADGTAEDNLPLFTAVTAAVWAGPDQSSGRAYVDALAAAGFLRPAMQLTHDKSTVGNPAESIQFSVRWGESCLIGQVGPATGTPVTVVAPVLAEGTCLVGRTRTIDW